MIRGSEVIAGAAARDATVVAFLFSWVGISAKGRAHNTLADDISHRHAVE